MAEPPAGYISFQRNSPGAKEYLNEVNAVKTDRKCNVTITDIKTWCVKWEAVRFLPTMSTFPFQCWTSQYIKNI